MDVGVLLLVLQVVVVLGEVGLGFLEVGVVDQWDVVDEVIDEKLGVGHEVVDGVPGFGFLDAFIQGATERFHHPHLKVRGMPEESGSQG